MRRQRGTVAAPATCFAAGVLGVVLAVIAGCGEAERTAEPIRFAYQDRVADAASILAIRRGFFAEEGLSVKPLRFTSGPACSEALYSGSADVGTMGDTTAVIAAARQAPLTIVASHGGGEHRHRIVVEAGSPIRSPAHLVGRRVAVKKGTSTYGGFLAFLAAKQLDPSKLHVVDMRPSDMPDALAAGSVEAIVASEPTPSLAEARGGRELATLGGLANSYPILLLARNDFLEERPADAARFLRAIARATAFIQSRPEEAAAILAEATGLNADVTQKAMSHHFYALRLDDATTDSLARTARFLEEQGTIAELPDLDRAIDRRYVEQALGKPARDAR